MEFSKKWGERVKKITEEIRKIKISLKSNSDWQDEIEKEISSIRSMISENEKIGQVNVNKAEKRIHILLKEMHQISVDYFRTLIEFETATQPISPLIKQKILEPYLLYFFEYGIILGLYEDDLNLVKQSLLHLMDARGKKNLLVHFSNLRDKLLNLDENDGFGNVKYSKKDIREILQFIDEIEEGERNISETQNNGTQNSS